MDTLYQIFSFFIHIDQELQWLVANYGAWIYVILFLIVFCETAFVVTPFLPGDSLLFAAGTIAAVGDLNVHVLVVTLIIAAILGDTVNYWIGHWVGPKVFNKTDSKLFNREYLLKAQSFYDKYGPKTIIIARFIPIIRTFAPFVAGIGHMRYPLFLLYNIVGAILWVTLIVYLSYIFGNMPIVKDNFAIVILAIIALSLTPPLYEYLRHKKEQKNVVD